MPVELPLDSCLERIVRVENTGTTVQRKVVLPGNSAVLAFWDRPLTDVMRFDGAAGAASLRDVLNFLNGQYNGTLPDRTVMQAIDLINGSKGRVRVGEVATRIFTSRRNFERRFQQAMHLLHDRRDPSAIPDAMAPELCRVFPIESTFLRSTLRYTLIR